ncbi:MAG: hypothetical protein EXS32_11710 [Opitutus sp.]|nr:hypothetical protein [Opitutus sp.]
MKKNTSKNTKSPAPAKKTAKLVAKKKTAPAVKRVATKPVVTTIVAQIDIGFGNALYIRGEGPGLSWDRGVLLDCVSDSEWKIALPESARPVIFKFLVNDLSWCNGEDYSVVPGGTVTLTPTF